MMASTTERDEGEKSDIDLIWTQVQERVVKLAGGDSGKLQKHLDIDGVLAFIDRAQASQKKKSEKYNWFRTAVSRTLQCIQTVGGVVAGAASQVSHVRIRVVGPTLIDIGIRSGRDVFQCPHFCHSSLAGLRGHV